MSRAVSPSTNRPTAFCGVTRALGHIARHGVSPSPMRRSRAPGAGLARSGPMPDEALVEAIRALLAASPFHGEGYRKIWARLRFAGIRTSKRRVLRLTREHGLQAPGRVGRPHGPKAHDGTIRTERVDEMWGTDLTSTLTGEGRPRSSSRSTTLDRVPGHPRRRDGRPASRRSSRSARACAPASAPSPRASRVA